MVSHDRAFMDNMVDRVAGIDNGEANLCQQLHRLPEGARERIERLRAEKAKQDEELAHLQAFVDRFRYKATKAKQAQDRAKRIERSWPSASSFPRRRSRCTSTSSSRRAQGDEVVQARGLAKRYGDKTVYDGADFTMYRGDKVALVGPNGAGKSTLLKMIAASSRLMRAASSTACTRRSPLRAASTRRAELGKHRVRRARPRGARLERLAGAHAAGRVPVHGRRCGQAGERALRAARRAVWRWRRCWWPRGRFCASTSRRTISTSPAPTSWSRRCSSSRHYFVHHATAPPHSQRGEPHRRGEARQDHRLRGRLRLLPVQVGGGWMVPPPMSIRWSTRVFERSGSAGKKVKGQSASDRAAADAEVGSGKSSAPKSKEQKRREAEARNRAYAALKNHRKRIAELDKQLERDNARMEELLALMADPDFYINESASSDAVAEHAKLKARIAEAEDEWFVLNEEVEEEMARPRAFVARVRVRCGGRARDGSERRGAGFRFRGIDFDGVGGFLRT